MLRKIAICANVGWLLFFAYLFFEHGRPRGGELDIVVVGSITLIVNLAALLKVGGKAAQSSLVGLYLERLRLEQKRRIDELRRPSN